uniref:Scavenger receptor class F member 1 n=1 Tax=Sphenodon punctatus TaxID=8508 RepID=A0A8D0GKB3_SPHPU
GICRCKPGFFGANCNSRCPDQYWGSDCKGSCLCHPNGKCDPASGQCTCHPNRWGLLCQSPCQCGPHGRCDPLTGACRCNPGWWAPTCKKSCQCNLASSRCDPVTGQCHCAQGWWGKRCSLRCHCHLSPCTQDTGKCECTAGLWGPLCQHPCNCQHGTCHPLDGHCSCHPGYQGQTCVDPCPAGTYGPQCRYRCGRCKGNQPCSPVDGFCLACESGWNGTRCSELCPPGHHGENCAQVCPPCRRGEACHPETGECLSCEPGRTGARCDAPCPSGLFGDGCQLICPDCFNGTCAPASGECVCQAGYWGTSCNETCLEGFYGANCSLPCPCAKGSCHPLSGDCRLSSKHQGALIASILTPLLLLVLCLSCCCCRTARLDARDRAAAADGDAVSRVKHHMRGALANLSSMMPCFSLGGYKLPRVTVSHHDAEMPFNPSFIEPPSAAWPSDSSFSSFDTDDEGPAYCVPAREGNAQEAFPEAPVFNSEDVSQLFAIPRTSSIAKAKRPSVSFAEGTKFSPQCQRASVEMPNPVRKAKPPRNASRINSPQPPPADAAEEPPQSEPPGDLVTGSRKVAQQVEALEAASKLSQLEAQGREPGVTTIYVTVGTAGKGFKVEGGGEGPVQAVLRRLGSLQRTTRSPKEEPRLRRSAESLQKPPRRALGLEKASRSLPELESMDQDVPGEKQSLAHTPSILKKAAAREGGQQAVETKQLELVQSCTQLESMEESGDAIPGGDEEPKYENVSPANGGLVPPPSEKSPSAT